MGARQFIKAGVVAAFSLLAAACASVRPSSAPAGRDHDNEQFSRALAHYGEAVRLLMHDDRDGALSNYLAAAQLDPSNETLQFQVALALLREKRADEAVALMEGAVRANPESERALIWLALVLRSAGREDAALDAYRRAQDAAPASAVAYLETAAILAQRGRGEDAIRLLEKAVPRVATNETEGVMRRLGELYLREAGAAGQKGARWRHLPEARRRMEDAAKKWPDDEALHLMLGNLRALDNDIEGAIACYDELERRNPEDVSIKEKLAIALMATGNKTGAVTALEGIASRRPTNGRVFYLLGELYEQLGQTNRAILNYDLAGRNAPADPLPFLKSSMLNAAAGRRTEAEAVLRRGLAGAPGQIRLKEMLAYVLMDQKKYAECLKTFEETAALLDTKDGHSLTPNFRINYAIALQLAGWNEAAADMLTVAVQTNRHAVDIYASYLLRDGTTNDLAQAATVLSLFEKKAPSDPRAPMFRGLILNSLERHAAAVAAFERAEDAAEKSDDPGRVLTGPFYFWFGAACERTTNITRAAQLFLKSIELNPDNAEARNYLAYMWAERGERLDEALVHIRKALEAEPDNAAFRDTLAWIHYMKGDAAKALVETQRALKDGTAADDPTINEHMGDILARLGRQSEAVEYWKRAYIRGSEAVGLPGKLRAAGLDPHALDAEAAAFKAGRVAPEKDKSE